MLLLLLLARSHGSLLLRFSQYLLSELLCYVSNTYHPSPNSSHSSSHHRTKSRMPANRAAVVLLLVKRQAASMLVTVHSALALLLLVVVREGRRGRRWLGVERGGGNGTGAPGGDLHGFESYHRRRVLASVE